ncbi:DUF1707 SHOCT-like domain-containing protein [Streptosporangium pseudovulgare]|uniref:DUF1707 domain-containing protein n=1 Tax=Streptosporangium pseudovulgare TaxID=35765 RepID=A0ABQ2RLL5_9ACTN|nr:DUF1707 domain-containing protein [Streptosporangium pseudovulgare]GGQ34373.1 hypothetical protein GCM10010140_75510 [Streptosporangium pseudovulgare]
MTSLDPAARVSGLAPQGADPALRASDADRDRVANVLSEALASGRLTSLEHADRLEATYNAVTVGELAPITRDLPDTTPAGAGAAPVRQEVGAVFSKVIRGGRWIAGRHTALNATFGALIVDLSDAVLPGREITLEVDCRFSKMIVRVPENSHVIDEVGALFAKRSISGGVGAADGPVIRVVGNVAFGKIIISRETTDWNLPPRR